MLCCHDNSLCLRSKTWRIRVIMLVTLLVKFRNKDCKTTELALLLQVLPVHIVTLVETLGSHLKCNSTEVRTKSTSTYPVGQQGYVSVCWKSSVLKCIWSKKFFAIIWKFTSFSIWKCGFYQKEPFQSAVIRPVMFEFSAGKCLHFARGQNDRITRLWRSKYFKTRVLEK